MYTINDREKVLLKLVPSLYSLPVDEGLEVLLDHLAKDLIEGFRRLGMDYPWVCETASWALLETFNLRQVNTDMKIFDSQVKNKDVFFDHWILADDSRIIDLTAPQFFWYMEELDLYRDAVESLDNIIKDIKEIQPFIFDKSKANLEYYLISPYQEGLEHFFNTRVLQQNRIRELLKS